MQVDWLGPLINIIWNKSETYISKVIENLIKEKITSASVSGTTSKSCFNPKKALQPFSSYVKGVSKKAGTLE